MAYNTLFNGTWLNPGQPKFFAYFSASASNVTGDGTNYQAVFDTEVIDHGGIYNNSTGLFTAPVTGHYLIASNILFTGATGGSTGQIVYQGSANVFNANRPGPFANGVDTSQPFVLQMTASDTLYVEVTWSGTTKTIGVVGGTLASGNASYFAACLLG